MSIFRFSLFTAAALACIGVASNGSAALLMHFDPQVMSSMFQDGNTTGGTVPVTGIGDSVGWIKDVVNGFDAQQASAKPVLATGPTAQSATVINYDGAQNLLVLDVDAGNISSPTTQLDTDTLTIVLAGKASSAGAELDHFINFNYDTGGSDLVSIEYDHATGELIGRASGGSVGIAYPTETWFVAELVWDSGNGMSLSVNDNLAGIDASAAVAGVDFDRFRFGALASGTSTLSGDMGDVYIFDSASEDNTALIAGLMSDYNVVPEPMGFVLIVLGGTLLPMFRRR